MGEAPPLHAFPGPIRVPLRTPPPRPPPLPPTRAAWACTVGSARRASRPRGSARPLPPLVPGSPCGGHAAGGRRFSPCPAPSSGAPEVHRSSREHAPLAPRCCRENAVLFHRSSRENAPLVPRRSPRGSAAACPRFLSCSGRRTCDCRWKHPPALAPATPHSPSRLSRRSRAIVVCTTFLNAPPLPPSSSLFVSLLRPFPAASDGFKRLTWTAQREKARKKVRACPLDHARKVKL
jgi:hypothetical protein